MRKILAVLILSGSTYFAAATAAAENRFAQLTIDTVIEKCDSSSCTHTGITHGLTNIELVPDSVNANNQQQFSGKWNGSQDQFNFTVKVFNRVDDYDNHVYYDVSLEITDTVTKQTTQSAVFDLRALSSMNTTVLWNSEKPSTDGKKTSAQLYVGPAQ